MLIQIVLIIGTMLVLAGAILTSTLVSAEALLHQTLLAKTQAAMTDATTSFITATQSAVRLYGTDSTTRLLASPKSEQLCGKDALSARDATCPFLATETWIVTGSSAASRAKPPANATAEAAYLAEAVSEQRISATISVVISDPTGTHVYSERSREVTARIFNAEPFVVLTASREISTQGGSFSASEGDTAGAFDNASAFNSQLAPSAVHPAAFTDTRILTSIDCKNSSDFAISPIGNAYFDPKLHPYGNVSWHNESLCSSGNSSIVGIPRGYVPPSGSLFVAQPADANVVWTKGDEDESSFPR